MQGAAWRFDNANDTGNLGSGGDDNLNSLDAGGNVYETPGATLQVNVSPLEYWRHTGGAPELVSYAGVSGQAVSASLTNYVYLLASGALAVNTTGFPNPEDAEHLRLAEVVCSGGGITSITDRRPRLRLADWTRVPSYTVVNLPSSPTGYPLAFASNGRKTGEGVGSGTGLLVYWDGVAWKRPADDSTVQA